MLRIIGQRFSSVLYKNYKGEIAKRDITVKDIYLGKNEYHKEKQLLLEVYDHDRKADRLYAVKDILEFK